MKRFAVLVIMMFMLYPIEVSAQLSPLTDGAPVDSYVPVIGNVTVTLNLDGVLGASWSGEDVTVNQQLRLDGPSRQVGILSVKMTLNNYTGGEASLVGDGQSLGANIQPNAADDTVSIGGLSWQTFSYFGQLQKGSVGHGREMAFDVRSGDGTYGRLSLAFELIDPTVEENSVTITQNGNRVGSGSVKANAEPIIDQFQQVTNLFAGFVTSKNGNPVQTGTITAVSGNGKFSARIGVMGERGGYGFNGTPMVISGLLNAPVDFYFGDYKLERAFLTSQGGVRRLDFQLPIVTSNVNFPDWDLDGVPDSKDLCPNSMSDVVDSNGCTCEQLVALKGGRCEVIPGYGPKWFPPVPPPPPKPLCDTPGKCLKTDVPKLCTENKTIVQDCNKCGCPAGFSCNPCPPDQPCITDGGCYKVVERTGLQCLKNKYRYGPGMNCSDLGPTYVDFFEKDPLKRDMTGFVNVKVSTGAFGGSKSDIKKQILNNIRLQRVCIDSIDLGCVPLDTKCPGEVTMEDDFQDVAGALGVFMSRKTTTDLAGSMGAPLNIGLASAGAVIGAYAAMSAAAGPVGFVIGVLIGTVIGLIGAFMSKVSIKFSLNTQAVKESSVRIPYICDPLLLTANQTCKSLVNNGDSNGKIDVLFIGDGYTAEEFEPIVKALVDVGANATGTRGEGLFSREPYKKNRGLFNVWTMTNQTNLSIRHEENEFAPSSGKQPNLRDVVQMASLCPQRDFVFVVSKDERYQSDCSFEGSQPCFLSMKDEGFAGRQVIRMMGKALAHLSDEWVFERERTERADRVLDLENVGAGKRPNCQSSQIDARNKWGDKIGAGGVIGLYEGCGGDCGKKCEMNWRPTYNSAMRNWTQRCSGGNGTCVAGPPFDPLYLVSEEAVMVALQDWGDVEQREEEERANASVVTGGSGASGTFGSMEDAAAANVTVQSNQTNQSGVSSSFKTHAVKIEVFSFDPQTVRVGLKDKVTWVNKDAVEHTVTGPGFSQKLASGQSFTWQFNKTGNVQYHCDIHPEMQGVVAVG